MNGLVDAYSQSIIAQAKPTNFDEWVIRYMGSGIADMFMRPYNFKVWGIPTHLVRLPHMICLSFGMQRMLTILFSLSAHSFRCNVIGWVSVSLPQTSSW